MRSHEVSQIKYLLLLHGKCLPTDSNLLPTESGQSQMLEMLLLLLVLEEVV